jgi:hypothetical protein
MTTLAEKMTFDQWETKYRVHLWNAGLFGPSRNALYEEYKTNSVDAFESALKEKELRQFAREFYGDLRENFNYSDIEVEEEYEEEVWSKNKKFEQYQKVLEKKIKQLNKPASSTTKTKKKRRSTHFTVKKKRNTMSS